MGIGMVSLLKDVEDQELLDELAISILGTLDVELSDEFVQKARNRIYAVRQEVTSRPS